MKELRFGTAGLPHSHPPVKYPDGLRLLRRLGPPGMGGLGHLEMEYVYGVRMSPQLAEKVRKVAEEEDITLTAHGPYYINLNSKEEEKVQASIKRVLDTARRAYLAGAFSVTFHAAFYQKMPPEEVYRTVKRRLEEIVETLNSEGVKVRISPETTGKASQFGSIDELIRLAEETEGVGLCIDFSHLHARSGGGFNTEEEFRGVLEKVERHLGSEALKSMHIHLSGIAYTQKGEKNHLVVRHSDMNYSGLLTIFREFEIAGAVVCESPNLQGDALLFKRDYLSL